MSEDHEQDRAVKAEKDGLDIVRDIPEFAQQGWEAIAEADLERLKWSWPVFPQAHGRAIS